MKLKEDMIYMGKWNSMKRKLSSERGESITEVLVASLVIAFGSIILATMVIASTRIIRKSITAYDQYMNIHNAVEMLDRNGKVGYFDIKTDGADGMTIADSSDTEKGVVGYLRKTSDTLKITNGSLHLFTGDSYQNNSAKDISLSGDSLSNVDVYTVSKEKESETKKEGEVPDLNQTTFSKYFG